MKDLEVDANSALATDELYESHSDYVQKVTVLAAEARAADFIPLPEEQLFIEEGQAAQMTPKDF